MKKITFAALTIAGVALTSTVGRGAQVHVPSDWPTIQAAIDAAGPFDTVVVAPGVYTENIVIDGKATRLVSEYALDGNLNHIRETVIDGSQPSHPDSASVIRLINAGDALVRGFTITNGKGTLWRDQADGLFYREGGGILAEGGSPRIYDNLIIGNDASNKTGAKSCGGGGVRCGYGTADLRNNVIAYNAGRYGGGLVLFFDVGTLINNVFYRNWGGEDFGGGAIWATSASGQHVLRNNTIAENRSALDGGGVLLWGNTGALEDNIIWGNKAANSPQIALRSGAAGTAVNYSDVEGGFAGSENIDSAPIFASPNLYLDPASPCADAGNPSEVRYDPADTLDALNALFPAQGLRSNDMGAYGGPGMHGVPDFNAPGVTVFDTALDFGTLAVGASAQLWLKIGKNNFGYLRIDSVRIIGDPLGALDAATPLPLAFGVLASDSLDSVAVEWTPDTYGLLIDTLYVFHSDVTLPGVIAVPIRGTAPGQTGDPNFDGLRSAADIIYLVNYVFKGGTAPLPVAASGDVNCDGNVTSTDIIYMVNFVFKSGPSPCD